MKIRNIWRIIAIELMVLFLLIGKNVAEANEIVRDGNFAISVMRENGDTILKFSDGRSHRYDFKGKIKVIKEKNLTGKMLRKRRNRILYIEKVTGKVINNKLDGRTSNGSYISYRCMRGKVRKGYKVNTYYIYSPYTTWVDDIDERYDVIVR